MISSRPTSRDEPGAVDGMSLGEARQRLVRDQLARLLEAGELRHAPRQQRLLRHIVEATLAGNAARLKGYSLGVEVFDRGADFDPNVDPIVRVEVGRLRSKLLAHYATAGADDAVA
jgi:adenylate cyclase